MSQFPTPPLMVKAVAKLRAVLGRPPADGNPNLPTHRPARPLPASENRSLRRAA